MIDKTNYSGTQERNGTVKSDKHTKRKRQKRIIGSKIEINLQFPYFFPAQYEHDTVPHATKAEANPF